MLGCVVDAVLQPMDALKYRSYAMYCLTYAIF